LRKRRPGAVGSECFGRRRLSGDVCWHTKETLTDPPESRVIVREDSWKPGPTIKFREHEGRGYWRGDSWVEIK
jgi:hypothetical protein